MVNILLVPSCWYLSELESDNRELATAALRTLWRCNAAVKAYVGRKGSNPFDAVIFSGGRIDGREATLADEMFEQFEQLFPEEAILMMERKSRDTVENVLLSIERAVDRFPEEKPRITVVSEPQHLRRLRILLKAAKKRGDIAAFETLVSNENYRDSLIGSATEALGCLCHMLSPTGKDPMTKLIRWVRSR